MFLQIMSVKKFQSYHGNDRLGFTFSHVQLSHTSGTLLEHTFVGFELRQPNLDFHFGFEADPINVLFDFVSRTFEFSEQSHFVGLKVVVLPNDLGVVKDVQDSHGTVQLDCEEHPTSYEFGDSFLPFFGKGGEHFIDHFDVSIFLFHFLFKENRHEIDFAENWVISTDNVRMFFVQ